MRSLVSAAVDGWHACMITGRECKGVIYCSDGSILRGERTKKDVPSSVFTGRCGATANLTLVCKSPRAECKNIKPSIVSGCFVAVPNERRLFLFIRLANFSGTVFNETKFTTSLVSGRQTAVCIIFVEVLYDRRSLYVVGDVKTTLVGIRAKCGD